MCLKKYNNYPRAAVEIEIITEKQQPTTLHSEGRKKFKKGNLALSGAYPYIADAVASLCTNFPNYKYIRNNKEYDLIERLNIKTETHCRAVLTIETFLDLALGEHKEHIPIFMKQLFQFAHNPPKIRYQLTGGKSFFTNPIRIDLLTKDRAAELGLTESSLEEREKESRRFSNLKGKPKPKIELVVLEFFKPAFKSVLTMNSKGTRGDKYIQLPPALEINIKEACKDADSGQVLINHLYVRRFLLLLNWHDNGKGDYINIEVVLCALACFPSYIKANGKDDNYISKKNKIVLESRLKMIIFIVNGMAGKGKLNGMHFVPRDFSKKGTQDFQFKPQYKFKVHRNNKPGDFVYSKKILENS